MPQRSNCSSAAAVVPPRLVTASRRVAGSAPSSASIAPAPRSVRETSARATAAESPSRFAACSMHSASRNTYAGPDPLTAVTEWNCDSGTSTISPTAWKSSRTNDRSRGVARPAAIAVMPSPSRAGVFGMARTTRTRPPHSRSIRSLPRPAITDTSSRFGSSPSSAGSAEIAVATSGQTCGFTATSSTGAPAACAGSSVVRMPSRAADVRAAGAGSIAITSCG